MSIFKYLCAHHSTSENSSQGLEHLSVQTLQVLPECFAVLLHPVRLPSCACVVAVGLELAGDRDRLLI